MCRVTTARSRRETDPADCVLALALIHLRERQAQPVLRNVVPVLALIRAELVARLGEAEGRGVRILYGGSVKAANAGAILALAHVDGALVGGASLTAAQFVPIVEAIARVARPERVFYFLYRR